MTPRLAFGLFVALPLSLPVTSAQAEPPPTPTLTGTNPASPGVSTRPRVQGFADGVTPQALHASPVGSAIVSAIGSSGTITIYAGDPTCSDVSAIAGEGQSAEFDGPGIEVMTPVETDAVTTFYASHSDLSGTSGCSAGLDYRQVTVPPGSPSLTSVTPPSPADDNAPHLIGAAPAESTVSIFTDPTCSGAAVATGGADEFSTGGIQVSVPDNSITTFYATAQWAGLSSACSSSSVVYQEVSPPPGEEPPPPGEGPPTGGKPPTPPAEGLVAPPGHGALPAPRLRTAPARANDNHPLIAGSAPGAEIVRIYDNADCAGGALAKGTAAQLVSGFSVQVADNTTTNFYGVAFDSAGKPSSCSLTPAVYTEDSSPPLTLITLGPGVKTRAPAPVFRFTDTTEEPGTAFFCKLDRRPWRTCQTPWRAPRLRRKGHVVRVRAVDAAGNAEAIGAKRRFKVVAPPRG